MLSFAITSEEEGTEKVDADSHSDSSSEDELVKLEVRPTREFPRQNQAAIINLQKRMTKCWKTLEPTYHLPKSAL